MRKRGYVLAALGLVAVLVAGGLFASNMGFKLNRFMQAAPAAVGGQTTISLPFNQQVGLNTAKDLFADIPNSVNLGRYVPSDGFVSEFYDGSGASTDFGLNPSQEGYFISVSADTNYIIVGSHAPGVPTFLDGPPASGGSAVGGQSLAPYPYHAVSQLAKDLRDEINNFVGDPSRVSNVGNYVESDGFVSEFYDGSGASTNFALVPGKAYFISVSAPTNFTYSHF